MDSTTLEAFSKELKTSIQSELTLKGWSSFEAGLVNVKVNTGGTGFTITDGSGYQISKFSFTTAATPGTPIDGLAAGSSLALDNVAFATKAYTTTPENLLNHFIDFKVYVTAPDGKKLTKTIKMADILTADKATATPKLTKFDPNSATLGPDQMTALAGYMNAAVNVVTGWTNLSGTPTGDVYPTVSRASDDPLTLTWKPDTFSFNIATGATSGTFMSGMSMGLNTADTGFGKFLTKGATVKIVAPKLDSTGVVTAAGSYTLSNVSFPMSKKAAGDEFESFSFILGAKTYPTTGSITIDKLTLSSSPMSDLAVAMQTKIRSTLKASDAITFNDTRVSQISVSVVNGKDLKITDAGGAEITGLTLNAKALAAVSVGGKNASIPKLGNSVTASYDPVSQKFSFTPPLGTGTIVALSGINNQMGITTPVTQDSGSDALMTAGAPDNINNAIRPSKMQRYGMKVEYDTVNEKFIFKSGTTGDGSSIKLSAPSTYASERFGLLADGNYEVKTSATAVRGITSTPAIMKGSPLGINANNNFSVNLTNNKFVVSVDDVKGTVYLEPKDTYTIDSFVLALQNGINRLAGPSDQKGLTGPMVSGVKVAYDTATNSLKFTSGTASTNSFIKVSGDSQWGLANVDGGRGSTSSWIKPTQYTQVVNGVAVSQYIDEFGKETFSPDGYKALPEWSPIFLEKGELTFDTGGNLVSPKQGSQLDTVYLPDGKGALTININYSKSTQFSSPYAVLSQSQDGAPEGDLVGLSLGDDGLVNASYSNGSQKSLGKVVLVNFTNPTGLRQIGDTSYYKSASSGTPKYGEAGSAGFGTVRSGATERANVDLTQELVDLITEQRNFQANAKAIETSTTLTQSIIQIRA
jgi:flagellar hook-basal body protein